MNELYEAIAGRHSVRSYVKESLTAEEIAALEAEISQCNAEGGLNLSLVTNEPRAFGGVMAHYGKFSGVSNYVVLKGEKSADLDERIGWYGERMVLRAQTLGLNTCWVAMTVSKGRAKAASGAQKGEKIVCMLALGRGATQGVPHKSKAMEELCTAQGALPDWFQCGMEAAMLAPTAMNQQKFRISLLPGGEVQARSLGGAYAKVDLGIVKLHFALGAQRKGRELWRTAF